MVLEDGQLLLLALTPEQPRLVTLLGARYEVYTMNCCAYSGAGA